MPYYIATLPHNKPHQKPGQKATPSPNIRTTPRISFPILMPCSQRGRLAWFEVSLDETKRAMCDMIPSARDGSVTDEGMVPSSAVHPNDIKHLAHQRLNLEGLLYCNTARSSSYAPPECLKTLKKMLFEPTRRGSGNRKSIPEPGPPETE